MCCGVWNGKIKCVRNSAENCEMFTVGKVYEVIDGCFIKDTGQKSFDYDCLTEFNKCNNSCFFEKCLSIKEQLLEWVKNDIIILETMSVVGNKILSILMANGVIATYDCGSEHINHYNDDLKFIRECEDEEYISRIWKLDSEYISIKNIFDQSKTLLWERGKEKIKDFSVKCIDESVKIVSKKDHKFFILNRCYNVVNGVITDENNFSWDNDGNYFYDFEDLNLYFSKNFYEKDVFKLVE